MKEVNNAERGQLHSVQLLVTTSYLRLVVEIFSRSYHNHSIRGRHNFSRPPKITEDMLFAVIVFGCLALSKCSYEDAILGKFLKFENSTQQMNNEINSLKKQVKILKENQRVTGSTDIPTIAFLAKDVESVSPTVGQNFVFKTTIFNHGNGYDNKTGIFVAPINGTYLFTIQLCVNNELRLHVEFTSNGNPLKRVYLDKISTCHSSNTIAVLEEGDGLWVKLIHMGTKLYNSEFWYNSFSGTVIHT